MNNLTEDDMVYKEKTN